MLADPVFPLESLTVRPWPDPVIDQLGHDPRSAYVERFWLGLLGPSATWLLRRLAAGFEAEPAGFDLDLAETARSLGLGQRGGKGGPFMRTIDRCCFFGVAQRVDPQTMRVRRRLPPLTRAQIGRLPETLKVEHVRWIDRDSGTPAAAVERMRRRSRKLALSLLELGEDVESTEAQLHRWRFHPAMAREATAWALHRHRAAEQAADDDANAARSGTAGS